jgi:hypothetical protein
MGLLEYGSIGVLGFQCIHPYSSTPPLQFVLRWGEAIERNRSLEDFVSLLNSLSHPSLGSLDRCVVPFEGFWDFAGQGRFAPRHIVSERTLLWK